MAKKSERIRVNLCLCGRMAIVYRCDKPQGFYAKCSGCEKKTEVFPGYNAAATNWNLTNMKGEGDEYT